MIPDIQKIEGEKCYLRSLEISDCLKAYVTWMNDDNINAYLESRFKSWTESDIKDYIVKMEESKSDYLLGIFDRKSDTHIGNIRIGSIHSYHRFASIGIIIGEKTFWGKGYATEAIELAVNYAFSDLKLHKVTAGSYDENEASIKAFENCGFKREGLLENQYYNGENYTDLVLLGKINEAG